VAPNLGKMSNVFWLAAGLIVISLLIMLGFTSCRQDHPEISLKPPEGEDVSTAPTPHYEPEEQPSFNDEETYLRVSIGPVLSSPRTRENYRQLVSYLSEKLERPVELVLRSSHGEVLQLMEQNLVDVALLSPSCYVELKEGGQDLELLAVSGINGEKEYRSYIITSSENQVEGIEDLRNRDFVFTDPISYSGSGYVLKLLSEMDTTPDAFFSQYFYSYHPDNSVTAVSEGWIEAGAVNNLVYYYMLESNPELREKLQVVESSNAVGYIPMVAGGELPGETREELREALLSMHRDSIGEEALSELRITRFHPPEEVPFEMDTETLKPEGEKD